MAPSSTPLWIVERRSVSRLALVRSNYEMNCEDIRTNCQLSLLSPEVFARQVIKGWDEGVLKMSLGEVPDQPSTLSRIRAILRLPWSFISLSCCMYLMARRDVPYCSPQCGRSGIEFGLWHERACVGK